jgi:regulator of sigma E protease
MDLLSNPVIAMILMLGGLVLFHELGHYLVGRWCGVAVEIFSIGFGAPIFSRRVGVTTYQVCWLPLGGFVKFYGASRNEDVPFEVKDALYFEASILKRTLIVSAGPAANLLLAFLIFWILVMRGMEVPPASIGDVLEGSRAQQAGIQPGDRILKLDGKDVQAWSDIERTISRNAERDLPLVVERKDQQLDLVLRPEAVQGVTLMGTKAQIGRAGVALGYPSAVVTVVDKNSVIGQVGLKTGDRVESYTDLMGNSVEIRGFHELLRLLKAWQVEKRESVNLLIDAAGVKRAVVVSPLSWPVPLEESDRAYARTLGVFDSHLTISEANNNSAKSLKAGDYIAAWNGQEIRSIYHLQEIMNDNVSPSVFMTVIRDGVPTKLDVQLKSVDVQRIEGALTIYILDVVMLGVSALPEPALIQYSNPFMAAVVAIKEAYHQTSVMLSSFLAILTGQMPVKALGSFISIAKVASDSAKAGLVTFFATMAVISINLGIVNLFPIPILDGGQLLMLGLERLKGKPLAESTVENFHKLGFVLVMCLIVLAMYNDLSRYWKTMIGSIIGTLN